MKVKTALRLEKKLRLNSKIVANKIFSDYCFDGDLMAICEKIKKYRDVINALIRLHDSNIVTRRSTRKSRRQFGWINYPDYRTGDETYGYESIESIKGNLSYISDRFGCSFRLRWLIEVPEKVESLNSKLQ